MRPLPRFRLLDGVVVAAVALLSLKALGLLAAAGAGGETERAEPGFGRVFSHARTNHVPGDPLTTGSIPSKEMKPAPADAAPSAPPPPLIPPSASERTLNDRLGERREELQQRQREMETREKLLQDQERKLEDRVGQGKGTEDGRKGGAAARIDGDAAALKPLVIMYETMKPKEAARVFDRLPLDVLLPVVTQMNARKMSEVLAAMSPENAEKLTIALAKRARAGGDERMPASGSSLPPGELPAIDPQPARR